MRTLLGLIGEAGAGKDTVANALMHSSRGYLASGQWSRIAFADELKRDMAEMLWPNINWRAAAGNLTGIAFIDAIKGEPEIRRLLQNYGQAHRKADPEYWIRRCFARLPDHKGNVVITDVRYRNEADAIKRVGGLLWRVVRPDNPHRLTGELAKHASETELAEYLTDDVILNDGPATKLYHEVALRAVALRGY